MKTDPLLLFFFIISKNLESAGGFKETLKTRTLIVEKKPMFSGPRVVF